MTLAAFHETNGLAAVLSRGLTFHAGLEVDDHDVTLSAGALHHHVLGGGLGVLLQGLLHLVIAHLVGGDAHLNTHVLGQLELRNDGQRRHQLVGTIFLLGSGGGAEVEHLELGVLLQSLVLHVSLDAGVELIGNTLGETLGNHALGSLAGAEAGNAGILGESIDGGVLDGGHLSGGGDSSKCCLAITCLVDLDIHNDAELEKTVKKRARILLHRITKSKSRIGHDNINCDIIVLLSLACA